MVEKKGAWLQFEGSLIGQGKEAAQKALAETPELATEDRGCDHGPAECGEFRLEVGRRIRLGYLREAHSAIPACRGRNYLLANPVF